MDVVVAVVVVVGVLVSVVVVVGGKVRTENFRRAVYGRIAVLDQPTASLPPPTTLGSALVGVQGPHAMP